MTKKLIWLYKKVPLVLQIVIGMCVGIALAYFCPNKASDVELFGKLFVSALKSVAPLLVLVLVTSAVALQGKNGRAKGLRWLFLCYCISTFSAAALAVGASFAFPVKFAEGVLNAASEQVAAPSSVSEVLLNIVLGAVTNPVKALAEANYISILVWATALGFCFRTASDSTHKVLSDLADVVTSVVKIVIRFAPLGVMGLVFSSCTSDGGFATLLSYIDILVLLVSVMAISALVVNPLIVAIVTKRNPYPLVFATLKDSAYYAFFTRSSAANIPVNMALCDRFGVPRALSSISISLGATVNMAGAAITISVLTLAAVNTLGGSVDIGSALLLCAVSALCACGSSGVAGGSLMLIPLACSLFGINNDVAMTVVGIGMLIGVVQDSCETALNSSSDALYTIAISQRKGYRVPAEESAASQIEAQQRKAAAASKRYSTSGEEA